MKRIVRSVVWELPSTVSVTGLCEKSSVKYPNAAECDRSVKIGKSRKYFRMCIYANIVFVLSHNYEISVRSYSHQKYNTIQLEFRKFSFSYNNKKDSGPIEFAYFY